MIPSVKVNMASSWFTQYLFKHALLRDVTYETVLLKRRVQYHGRAARWLESHAGERRDE